MGEQNRWEIVQAIVERWASTVKPEAVFVFGSSSRGTERPDSDIDFIVIWDGAPEMSNRHRRIVLRDLAGDVPLPVDVLTYTTQEWETAVTDPLSFTAQIAKEAKVVYGGFH